MKKYDVFICYSMHDAETALKICARLERAHVTVFSDAFSKIGEDFAYVVTHAIINSQCLLYLHSEYSSQSNWIRKEIEYAIEKGLQVKKGKLTVAELTDVLEMRPSISRDHSM